MPSWRAGGWGSIWLGSRAGAQGLDLERVLSLDQGRPEPGGREWFGWELGAGPWGDAGPRAWGMAQPGTGGCRPDGVGAGPAGPAYRMPAL